MEDADKLFESAPADNAADALFNNHPGETTQEIAPKYSEAESAGIGALQGATLGFADELEGGVKGGLESLTTGSPLIDSYRKYQQLAQKRADEAQKANPKSYMAGNVGGGLATMLVPGLGEMNMGKAAALGAATGLGTSKSDIIGPDADIAGAAKDVALGAGVGAVGQKLGEAVGGLVSPAARAAAASEQASKAAGVKFAQEYAGAGSTLPEMAKGVGKTAAEEGILSFKGAQQSYAKVLDAINENEKALTPLLQKAQDAMTPEAQQTAGHLGEKIIQKGEEFLDSYANRPEGYKEVQDVFKQYYPFFQKAVDAAGDDLVKLNQLKQGIYKDVVSLSKSAYGPNATPGVNAKVDMLKQVGGIIRQHIEDVANAAEPGLGDQIKATNKTLGNLYTLEDSVFKLAGKDANRGMLDLKDKLLGGAALLSHNPILAGAGLAAKGAEMAAGNQPISRLGQIAASKANLMASKALAPVGEGLSEAVTAAGAKTFGGQEAIEKSQSAMDKNPVNVSRVTYNASPDQLKALVSQPAPKQISSAVQTLQNALNNKDEAVKNNALFSILQTPEGRQWLKTNLQ